MNDQTLMAFEDVWMPLPTGERVSITTAVDDATAETVAPFDYAWTGTTSFQRSGIPPELPEDWGIGVIVGASGSGKSSMLASFGSTVEPDWDDRAIAAQFNGPSDALERFAAVGLNSVPTWTKPYAVLSTGERFRADLARMLGSNVVIDEFTSVVDRTVAMSASHALRRWVDQTGVSRLVIATCHRDVLPWLKPDWVIDLDIRSWSLYPRGCLQRPDVVVAVHAATVSAWDVFAPHHYLIDTLNPAARCYVATIGDALFGFASVLPFPNGQLTNAYREHRTVVLPDFQGLGLGVRLSDFIAGHYVNQGCRYFSRTAHPRMGGYRDGSPLWRATSSSRKQARALTSYMSDEYIAKRARTGWDAWEFDTDRVAWSHEYVGLNPVTHGRIDKINDRTMSMELA